MKTSSYHFHLMPALVMAVGGLAATLQAADLTGTGYIDLFGDASAPTPGTAGGYRFVWHPHYSSLFIGDKPAGQAFGWDSVSLLGNNASGFGVAVGSNSIAGLEATAVGYASSAFENSIAIGESALAEAVYAIAIGTKEFDFSGPEAYEYPAIAWQPYSIAIGTASEAGGWNSIALGLGAKAYADNSVAIIGVASGVGSIALRGMAVGNDSFAIAGGATYGDYSFAGPYAVAYAKYGVVLGQGADANHRKDASLVDPVTAVSGDPIFIVGKGSASNALTVYRDGSARVDGPLQIKAGSGYLTIQPGGTTNRTLTLPDADGALLASTSTLDASMLSGAVPSESLPANVTRLGGTVELDSAETTGSLPWSRVANKPATLAGYLPSGNVDAEGRITVPIRILPQGDIPMFGARP